MTEFAHAQGVCAMAAYQRAELFGAAHGHRLTGDLVRYTIEVLMSFNARLYGRSARNLMLKTVACAQRYIGPPAVLTTAGAACGDAR